MKKAVCIILLFTTIISSSFFVTGCGGSSGSSVFNAITAGVLILAFTATGPAAVAFAASQREKPDAAISGALTTSETSYKLVITPTGQASVATVTSTLNDQSTNTITFAQLSINANSTNGQYLVEVYPAGALNTAQPIFKYYFVQSVTDGQQANHTHDITTTDTAKALAYSKWAGTTTNTINTFAPNATELNNLKTMIDTSLETIANFVPATRTNFQWANAVTTKAQDIADDTPIPHTEQSENYRTGLITLSLNYGIDFSNHLAPERKLLTGLPAAEPMNIIAFFSIDDSAAQRTLGNFYRFKADPPNDTKLIRYWKTDTTLIGQEPSSTLNALNGITDPVLAFAEGDDGYRHHGLTSKIYHTSNQQAALVAGDIYYFYVNNRFGLMLVHSVTENGEATVAYKYHVEPNVTSMTD